MELDGLLPQCKWCLSFFFLKGNLDTDKHTGTMSFKEKGRDWDYLCQREPKIASSHQKPKDRPGRGLLTN